VLKFWNWKIATSSSIKVLLSNSATICITFFPSYKSFHHIKRFKVHKFNINVNMLWTLLNANDRKRARTTKTSTIIHMCNACNSYSKSLFTKLMEWVFNCSISFSFCMDTLIENTIFRGSKNNQ
jgi:hypothetical protein